MAAEQPRIVKGEDDRALCTQPLQRAKIEIAAVQVVTVDDVRLIGEVQDPARSGEVEVFDTRPLVDHLRRLSCQPGQPGCAARSRDLQILEMRRVRQPEPLPSAPHLFVRHEENVRIVAELEADGHLRPVPTQAVFTEQIARDAFSAAALVCRADLEDGGLYRHDVSRRMPSADGGRNRRRPSRARESDSVENGRQPPARCRCQNSSRHR